MSASVAHATLGPVRCGPPISILGPEDHLHSEVWFGDVQKVDELIRIKGNLNYETIWTNGNYQL